MHSFAINPTVNFTSADVRQACCFFKTHHARFMATFRAPEPEASLITQPNYAVRFYADTGLALFRHPLRTAYFRRKWTSLGCRTDNYWSPLGPCSKMGEQH